MLDHNLFAELEVRERERRLRDGSHRARLIELAQAGHPSTDPGLRGLIAGALLRLAGAIDGSAIARTAAQQGGR